MAPITGLPELDLDNLDLLNERFDSGSVALTANDDITKLPPWLFGETPDELGRLQNATACVVVLVESKKDSSITDAFYFYFYSYDQGPNITQVLHPLDGLLEDIERGRHYGDHVGDWEHNMVRFRDGKPTGIYYSQHEDGAAYKWDDATLSIENERPVVYSAYGSHANYATPGDHVHDSALWDYCDTGRRWDPVSSAYFYRFDPVTSKLTRIFTPGSPGVGNSTSFLYYAGRWGDLEYPDDNPRQQTVPYFGMKRYVSGPTGPLTKQLVRKQLSPGRRQKMSWVQWGVGIFMSMYPTFFRGWRAWLSGIVFIGLLVSIVFGIRYAVKRYRLRTKGYKKIDADADIPLDSMGYRDDTAVHYANANDA